jgi:RNA polymerase sigma-70 factor (ECF subfamily)
LAGPTDDDSWRAWLDRHGPATVLYARQWVHSRADAEDAMQTAILNFWQHRSTAADPTAYLYACARSAARSLARSKSRRLKLERPGAGTTPDSLILPDPDRNLRRQAVEEALAQLPPDQREILVLKVWSDPTFAQVAEVPGINANTAVSRYRYALNRLESLLSQEVRP